MEVLRTFTMLEGQKVRSNKRDQNRLNTFIERKSVCSELPFHSLDNAEIQTMSAEQISAKKPKTFSELIKLNKLKEENVHLNSSITILEENIIKGNSKLANAEKVISDLRNKLLDEENKLKSEKSVISNLKQEICIKGNKLNEAEILHLREALVGVADNEKANVNLANELTNEVKTRKMQFEQQDQIKLDSEQNTIYSTTNRKDSSAANVRKSDRKKQKEEKKAAHSRREHRKYTTSV